MTKTVDGSKFFIIGNNLSLDFVNTQTLENGENKDLLTGFEDFAAWALAVGLLELPQAKKLVESWQGRREAEQVFVQALDFRRALREMVETVMRGKDVKPQTIKTINELLRDHHGYTELVKTINGFEKRFRSDFREPRQLLVPVAESAADLLCYGEPAYLKKCENPTCILHFYDTTKNHSRRWCSMTGCGNRAKAAAFYQRQRERQKAADKRRNR